MTTYYNKFEIEDAMKVIVEDYLKDCIECEELPEDFIDLIKYNFLAKYVSFNKEEKAIEIGVEDTTVTDSHYPVIEIFSFPIEKSNKWLDNSFKYENDDFAFYGKLLNKRKYNHSDVEVVVL
ncbi:hypothetical protein [Gillisia hiemivivida]|jgi:hypothetical protein|uniref:Uncharacterized protein n=1 Tax=Gillisia hiemivivida TaxID=291190 RepID=A0A5C6ZQ21_9FLAO|nr:hypothetical protein [Gillisia hiemivivida]TXD92578.1 hypothetical protein ES724_13135 [Gillisia hiemivivida]